MKKCLCYLLVLIFFFIYGSTSAQTDSGYFDLGRVKLRKDFTQHVTIKGSDLEHMQFARLSDAIAPWLQGTLSNVYTLVFVVDGNLVSDVNAWSIQDIEEITLIQNAVSQVNGSENNQQLVLVTTKRKHASSKGLVLTGNSSLLNVDDKNVNNQESETNFYHQYHVGGWHSKGRFSYGVSANWLRDVSPYTKDLFDINKPLQMNRFRFNGWLDAALAEGHMVSLRLNVAPQTISHDYDYFAGLYDQHDKGKSKNTIINPSIHLSNRITKDLQHELDFSFMTNRATWDHSILNEHRSPVYNYTQITHTLSKFRNVLLRDRISYTRSFGQWQFQPAVSFSYRSTKQEMEYNQTIYDNGSISSYGYGATFLNAESYILTPALSLHYGNAFSISAGVAVKLKKDNSFYEDKAYPFITTMLDVLRIAKPGNPNSLKIFGSFARPGYFQDYDYRQNDLQYDLDPVLANVWGMAGGIVLHTPYTGDPTIQHFEAGAVFSTPGDKLQVSYNYDNRKYVGDLLIPVASTTGFDWHLYHPEYRYSAHRLAVVLRVMDLDEVRWLAGINATGLKYDLSDEDDFPNWSSTRDANNNKMLLAGGLTNRFSYHGFSAGFDLLYLFNEYRPGSTPGSVEKNNTLRLNNIYAGYSFKIRKSKPLEVYLSGRNVIQSKDSQFPDHRRYYGAGFKFEL
jgi:hypothetical protein